MPEHISDREAFNVEPLACVLRAVRRAGTPKGEGSVAIIGLGYIGLLLAQVLQRNNQTVLGLDLNPQRLGLAFNMEWCNHVFNPQHQQHELVTALQQFPCHAVDVVYLTVVNAGTLKQAFQLVRNGGTLVLMAGNTQGDILDPATCYYREINLITSYSPALQDLAEAARLITSRSISLNPLITHPMPITDFNHGLEQYQQGKAIKVFFSYPQADDETNNLTIT
jgi:threonine dehydrogenase-like Zn-dependent dehydrogenase